MYPTTLKEIMRSPMLSCVRNWTKVRTKSSLKTMSRWIKVLTMSTVRSRNRHVVCSDFKISSSLSTHELKDFLFKSSLSLAISCPA